MGRLSRGLGLLAASDGPDLAAELHTLGGEAAMVRLPDVARMAWEGENAARQLGIGRDAQIVCNHILRDLGDLLRKLSDAGTVAANQQPASEIRSGRVLVIDDSPVAAQALVDAFESHGFDVRSAITRGAAENLLRAFSPEVLVTDVTMPGMDVADLCRRFRECRQVRRHILVVVSGHPESELRARLAQLQPDAFVCKMEGVEAVLARVASFAGGV